MLLVSHGQNLRLVNVVNLERLQHLRLNEMADARLGHDRDGDGGLDGADDGGVAHARDAAVAADVGGDALEKAWDARTTARPLALPTYLRHDLALGRYADEYVRDVHPEHRSDVGGQRLGERHRRTRARTACSTFSIARSR